MSRKVSYQDYKRLIRTGQKKSVYGLVFFWMPYERFVFKVGISKRCGIASVRNKEKRRLRSFVSYLNFNQPLLILVVNTHQLDMNYEKKRDYFMRSFEMAVK